MYGDGYPADTTSVSDVERARDDILRDFGSVKALLLDAGTVPGLAAVDELASRDRVNTPGR